MNHKEKKELTAAQIVLLVSATIGVCVVVWLAWGRPSQQSINSYDECARAGYPVQDSYPEACVTPDGQRFVRSIK